MKNQASSRVFFHPYAKAVRMRSAIGVTSSFLGQCPLQSPSAGFSFTAIRFKQIELPYPVRSDHIPVDGIGNEEKPDCRCYY